MKKPAKKKSDLEIENAALRAENDSLRAENSAWKTRVRRIYRETRQLCADLDPVPLRSPAMLSKHKNDQLVEAVMQIAEAEWHADIRDDESGAVRIDEYIRGEFGLQWGSADVNNLNKARRYRPQSFSWCGAFAAYCYGRGAEMQARIRKYTLPSCSRLFRDWGGSDRMMGGNDPDKGLPPFWPRRGDIVTVRVDGSVMRAYGSHIVLCADVDTSKGTFSTIEGNAWGYFPDGTRGEGVTRNERDVSTIAKIYRPVATDFDQ